MLKHQLTSARAEHEKGSFTQASFSRNGRVFRRRWICLYEGVRMRHIIAFLNEPSLTKEKNINDASIYKRNEKRVLVGAEASDVEICHIKFVVHGDVEGVLCGSRRLFFHD
jgi:hypothetical protein